MNTFPENKSPQVNDKSYWSLGDIIDFEIFCREDGQSSEGGKLQKRDEALRKRFKREWSWNQKFLAWLEQRQEERYGSVENSLGHDIEGQKIWVIAILALMGGTIAISAFKSFFPGSLSHPEESKALFNVHFFWLICIGVPALFSFLGFGMLFSSGVNSNSWMSRFRPPTFLIGLVFGIFKGLTFLRIGKSDVQTETEFQLRKKAFFNNLKYLVRQHSGVLTLELLGLLHWFGVAFTAVILLAVTVFANGSSIQFAWQSTGGVQAAQMHEIVKAISIPWDWLSDGNFGSLDLEQIRETQFEKGSDNKIPPRHQWSEFLTASALVYGLLPRALLLLLTHRRTKLALKSYSPSDEPRFSDLKDRLTPRVVISHPSEEDDSCDPGNPKPEPQTQPPTTIPGVNGTILIPTDMEEKNRDALLAWWRKKYGPGSSHDPDIVPFSHEPTCLKQTFSAIERLKPPVILIAHSSPSPINQDLSLLRRLRELAGSSAVLQIGLLGTKQHELLGGPAKPGDVRIWKLKTDADLGDPGLKIFALIEPPTSGSQS